MNDLYIHFIGIIAGIITTSSFLPQIIKIIRTKNVRDISMSMYIILSAGIFLWLVYGILIDKFPIILANGVALILCVFIASMKIIFGKKEN